MILYLSDWQRFPSAIPDYDTKNESFLKLARMYRSMGIKNWAFLLALMTPALKGVDPHSPDLTIEQKAMIAQECKYNPWYFLREVLRVPQVGGEGVPLIANRGNIALYWMFLNHIDTGLIQPRQTGKSISVDGMMVWVIYIAGYRSKIVMMTKDDKLRSENIDRLKEMRNQLPKFLVMKDKSDTDNQDGLTYNRLHNKYLTAVKQSSEAAANNVGRGLTTPILYCDEGPFISHIQIALGAALPGCNRAREQARLNNNPYGNIFTTTAGKKDDRDGRYMYQMFHDGTVWNEIYFDARNPAELLELITTNRNNSNSAPFVNITLSHRQLGFTDEWLRDQIMRARQSKAASERDFLNMWTSGTQRSPLSAELNEIIRASEMDPLYSEIIDRYILRWYMEEEKIARFMEENHCVISIDPSNAVGRDAIALVMTDVSTMQVVAAGSYNETYLMKFADYVVSLLLKYPKTTLVIETNHASGTAIVDYAMLKLTALGVDPFTRIFNRIVDQDRLEEDGIREMLRRPVHYRPERFYEQHKRHFGFITTSDSRTMFYSTLIVNAAKQAGHLVRDKTLATEIRSLVEKNGRIDHTSSGHDDMVIAWLMCHWFVHNARNLAFYGIDRATVLTSVNERGEEVTPEEELERSRQECFVAEIEQLLEQLRETRDEIMSMKLEHRLRFLQTLLKDSTVTQASNIDALIQQTKDERNKRAKLQGHERGTQSRFRELTPRQDMPRPAFLHKYAARNNRFANINFHEAA